ncbi:MAG: hypothetical protein DRJ03_09995 [Chloroflexi bacterium]|nr:MAG: hypothetical protein DRI81_03340 [Chloroflexota bacterium]RLC86033.1 MAG: hypothetical protein DRJ03_09995 [Chloroflexota bacterium]
MIVSVGDIRRIWGEIDLGEGIHPYEERIFPTFCQIANRSEKILEIGVGRGRMVKILKANGVAADFFCLDLVAEHARDAPENGVLGDSRELGFRDRSFDLTYSLGVVEHFPETLKAIKEHARVTKWGGYVFISTPHRSLATFVRLLIFHLKLKGKHHASFEVLLGRNISLRQMRQYCKEAGLEIIQLSASGPIIPAANPLLQRLVNVIPLPSRKFGAYLCCLARKLDA